MSPDPPDRLTAALSGRYRVERELGQGGMATVFLAEDLKHGREVALKVLRPELAAVMGAERFLSEIRTTAALQHPHILPLFDSGSADGVLFYVMPYVEGESLRDRLHREKQLPVEEAVRIARSVAAALHAAHEHGVIHRDVKPENILLSRGEPLVADFGIALAVSAAGGGRLTETGLSLGTPYYMSPEQATADRDPGPASDVYSLGCVLYEMLVGDPPHTGSTAQAVLAKILTEEPRPVATLRRTVPAHVADAVARALERLPADRFASADGFARALADSGFRHTLPPAANRSAVATAAPTPAGDPTSAAAAATRARGHLSPARAVLGGAAVPWTVAFAATVALVWNLLATPSAPPATTVRAALDFGAHQLEGGPGTLRISPDGRTLAIVAESANVSYLAVRSVAEADFRRLPGTERAWSAAFSPDGAWLAYHQEDARSIMKVSVLGGAPQPVVRGVLEGVVLDWSEQGWILYSQEPDALFRVRDAGGEPELLTRDELMTAGALLPGGTKILYTPLNGGIVLLDREAASTSMLIPDGTHPRYVSETGHLLWVDASGSMWAAGFDPRTGALATERAIVLDGVYREGLEWARYDVSRDGTLVYGTGGRSGGNARRMVTVGLDGVVEVESLEPRRMWLPRWSPDGRYVAYSGSEPGDATGSHIFVYDVLVKSRPQRLTSSGVNEYPVWSPDGSRVAFASRREGTDGHDLFVKSVGGDAPERLLWSAPGEQLPSHWFEERRISIQNGPRSEPWVVTLPAADARDTVVARPFFESESFHEAMYVARRGDLAVYSSDAERGRWEVFVRSFPDPGAPLRISEGGGDFPVWSPDGTTVYYVKPRAEDTLYAARIDRGPPLRVVSRTPLMAWPLLRIFDPHPGGTRFLTTRSDRPEADGAAERVPERHFVVTNWFAELHARSGGAGR